MKALLLIMLGGVLVNNYALEKFLGVGPVLGGRKYGSAAMGFSVAAVMLLAAAVTWAALPAACAARRGIS